MQQYLINMTAIWLLSLLFFDVFLRRENYHGYNRFYLLFTMLLGALLPLVQWGRDAYVYPASMHTQVERVVAAKQTIVAAVAPATTMNWGQWLVMVYAVGVLAALCLLCADIFRLIRFSAKGRHSNQNGWKIVETGAEHAPFSFHNTLYICSRRKYKDEEWNMIVVHEMRHMSLWHLADLILIHLARIVFWFHPLIYVYNKRLLLVHEYQADNAAASQPQQYGKFLIEQAVLHAAPSIAHSFNRSPIKNRIVMLTRNSTTSSRAKMLVLLPLIIVAAGCFTKEEAASQFVKNGNEVTYRGNIITLSEPIVDTIEVMDPVTGKTFTQTRIFNPIPVSLNGKKIYKPDEAIPPQYHAGDKAFEELIFNTVVENMKTFPDGDYSLQLTNLVIDETGKVVFYEFDGIKRMEFDNNSLVGDDSVKSIRENIDRLLSNAPAMKPATRKEGNVITRLQTGFQLPVIFVRNHEVTYGRPAMVG